MKPVASTIAAAWLVAGCTTFMNNAKDGLQGDFASHIPARTAVLPCDVWMDASLDGISATDRKWICDKLDEAVTDGFRSQPYMRGFSPKVVGRLLEQARWPGAVSEGFAIMKDAAAKAGCMTRERPLCSGAAALYAATLQDNAAWQMWLARFSDAQKHADAVLIPALVAARDARENDRGLVALTRGVTFTLWLVDTDTGKLIWTRSKGGLDTVRALPEKSAQLRVPDWDVPLKRALTQDFWRDYPGRLVLD